MSVTIVVGGAGNQVTGGNISYSRDGVYSYMFVYGDRKRIETTVAEVGALLTDNVVLEENWDTTVSWNSASAKTDRAKYQDHYRRFSIDPEDDNLATIDNLANTGSNSPKGYREFETTLVRMKLPTQDATELSAYSDVENSGTWEQTSESGVSVNVDNNGNAPAILFNCTIDIKDETKGYNKSAVIRMVSLGRGYADKFVTGSNIETDYVPFMSIKKDRFKSEYVRESYRDNPAGTATNGTGIDDSGNISQYAINQNKTFGRLQMGGGVTLIGNAGVNVGDTVSTLSIYYDNSYVTKSVEFLVVSRVYDFTTDTTSIKFGRP